MSCQKGQVPKVLALAVVAVAVAAVAVVAPVSVVLSERTNWENLLP